MQRIILSALCALLSCAVLCRNADAEKRIKIGVSVPLSGAGAAYGTDIKNALLYANKHLANSAYDLVIEDDRCTDKDAVTIAHKLVDIDKVDYMLGFGCSGTVLASAPVYEKAKIVVIASGTGAPLITEAGDYIFRTKPTLTIAADVLARDMASKFKKVGILTEETAYCKGLTDAVMKTAATLNLEVLNESYLPNTEDFKTMLLKLKAKGVEMLAGVRYERIDDAGLTISRGTKSPETRLLEVDSVVLCAGQESLRDLAAPLRGAGVTVHLIGGADVAAELDARRAIEQGTLLAGRI